MSLMGVLTASGAFSGLLGTQVLPSPHLSPPPSLPYSFSFHHPDSTEDDNADSHCSLPESALPQFPTPPPTPHPLCQGCSAFTPVF